MKILSAHQLKNVDAATVVAQKISSKELMERAAIAIIDRLKKIFDLENTVFTIFCGNGNNGGDGLAIAKHLHWLKANVTVYLIISDKYSEDNIANQQLLETLLPIERIAPDSIPVTVKEGVILDCLLGYGLSRPLEENWVPLINSINQSGLPVYSVDLPSGMFADIHTPSGSPVVRATHTFTFQLPNLGLLMPENAAYTASFEVVDIQLDATSIANTVTPYRFVTKTFVAGMFRPSSRFSHKGTFGHSLILGGCYGKIGAVLLAAKAALKTGCGLVTTYIPGCGYPIIQTAFPEAMVLTDEGEKEIKAFPDTKAFSAVGIGVGMGTAPATKDALQGLLNGGIEVPLVIDADAINLLGMHKEMYDLLPAGSIITPHPKELERLIGLWENDFDKLIKTQELAQRYNIIILIKGANTAVVLPDKSVYFNETGNAGMATGGSGDVLTGIITSLLAQGLLPEKAAIAGVYLHGLAGDKAKIAEGEKSLIASDIIAAMGAAYNELLSAD